MKKKNQISITISKPVHLFRDDISEIEAILKDELHASDLNISFDDYESNSFLGIPEEQKAVSEIKISIYTPYLLIGIGKTFYFISSHEPDLKLTGAVSKIKDLLQRRLRYYEFYFVKGVTWMSYLLGMISLSLFLFLELTRSAKILLLLATLLSFSLWTFRCFHPVISIIEFTSRKDIPSFFKRNKDAIYVGLIVGIPVAIVSFLLGTLFSK